MEGPGDGFRVHASIGISADEMEVAMATSEVPRQPTNRIGVFHLAATGGVGAVIIFELSWLGTAISFANPSHQYIGLFTLADIQSETALLEGSLWSLLFGGLSGAVMAAIYNLFAGLRR